MIRTFGFLIIFAACCVFAGAQKPTKEVSAAELRGELAELNKSFTYKGKAINPRAIKDLTSWVSDPLPGPVAIDVEGTFETNRYFGDYLTEVGGFVRIDLTQKYLEEAGSFAYKRLSRLANGIHVLQTSYWGGGTGVFQSILLVEVSIDYEYAETGRRRSQLVLRRRGEFGIGDRYAGEIRVLAKSNTIIVGPDQGNIKKPFSIVIR